MGRRKMPSLPLGSLNCQTSTPFITITVFLLYFHLKSENCWLLNINNRLKYQKVIQCN